MVFQINNFIISLKNYTLIRRSRSVFYGEYCPCGNFAQIFRISFIVVYVMETVQ